MNIPYLRDQRSILSFGFCCALREVCCFTHLLSISIRLIASTYLCDEVKMKYSAPQVPSHVTGCLTCISLPQTCLTFGQAIDVKLHAATRRRALCSGTPAQRSAIKLRDYLFSPCSLINSVCTSDGSFCPRLDPFTIRLW